jgi:hypothetical protein
VIVLIVTGLVATVAATQGDAGVLPANPLPPLVIASGGVAGVNGRVGGVFANPANAVTTQGIELSFTRFPRTRLEGLSVVGVTGGRLSILAGLWSYALKDIFDADVLAQDPSLAELGLSSAAGALGVAWRSRHWSIGVSAAMRTQTIVGAQTSAKSWSAGFRLNVGPLELGGASVDMPWSHAASAAAPSRAVVMGAAATTAISSIVRVRLEVNARAPDHRLRGTEYGFSPSIRIGPLELTAGHWSNAGWSGGAGVEHARWRVNVSTNFVGGERLDQRLAFSATYR